MAQTCSKCSRANPDDASYCYHDGSVLGDPRANGGPLNTGSQTFPHQFVFPSGKACRNFDQLAMACQEHWLEAMDLLQQGFLEAFLGGLGRADLALAARFADMVLVLCSGRLAAQGPPAEALSDRTLAEVFRISAYRAPHQGEMLVVPWSNV